MTITGWVRSVARQWQSPQRPPFADLQPTVEWQVNGHCNYDCVYCIQSRASRVGVPDEQTVKGIVGGFARLPGVWEIKMSGGEPFAFKGFTTLVIPQLVERTKHHLSVLTNFSAPLEILERFCVMTGERLRISSASLHPDSVDVGEFIDKAVAYRELRTRHNPFSSFVVNVVLVPGYVANHFAFRDRLLENDFRYFPQWMKIKGGVYPYGEDERSMIEVLTAGSHDPREVNRAPSYEGVHCEAGVWYFTVDQTGEAYVCRTAKRFLETDGSGRLGNIATGDFALRDRGAACPYPICPCTVPVNRGIVRLSADRLNRQGSTDGTG